MSASPLISDLEPGDPRWDTALLVLQELRSHLTADTLDTVLREGTPQGLRFTGIFVDGVYVAIAGWRIISNTSALRKLYVDDLVAAASLRSAGHGHLLLDHLTERARQANCTTIDLDSGGQRFDAHRFYLRVPRSCVCTECVVLDMPHVPKTCHMGAM
ncbi:GNAT family N-acetyltransferase [Jonesia quinghaiensis]|uniref:GNAT family N-acetyltransferase n=1 Tax=Jonesia quinghaiensis TaxID=262806 RepID=UPI0004206EB5|nr:GNAT family N-acetyltransferase [Jonesia quinghaiensis]